MMKEQNLPLSTEVLHQACLLTQHAGLGSSALEGTPTNPYLEKAKARLDIIQPLKNPIGIQNFEPKWRALARKITWDDLVVKNPPVFKSLPVHEKHIALVAPHYFIARQADLSKAQSMLDAMKPEQRSAFVSSMLDSETTVLVRQGEMRKLERFVERQLHRAGVEAHLVFCPTEWRNTNAAAVNATKALKNFTPEFDTLIAQEATGNVYVTLSPFMMAHHTKEEIHASLMHEIGHVALNHGQQTTQWIEDQRIDQKWDTMPAGPERDIWMAQVKQGLLNLYRRQELEADAFVVKMGHGEALINLLARMNHLKESVRQNDDPKRSNACEDVYMQDYKDNNLNDHPSHLQRIANIMQLQEVRGKDWDKQRDTIIDHVDDALPKYAPKVFPDASERKDRARGN